MLPLLATATVACGALACTANTAACQSKSTTSKSTQTKSTSKKKPPQTPGGANQVEGLNGKVGDMLFTGRWRFQVQKVETVETYTLTVPTSEQDYSKYASSATLDDKTKSFTPKEGQTLVAVKALVKNAQTSTQQLGCYLGDPKTAIADTKGNSYPPIAYDMISKGAWVTKPLLPGSGEELTVLFAVPKGTELKDLIFSLYNWSDIKGKEVRVSLVKG